MAIMRIERVIRRCESPVCTHRTHLWRAWFDSPQGYSLDGRWYCSSECFERALVAAIEGASTQADQTPAKSHRVPMGLLMLSRGMVDSEQLKRALKAQKDSGTGRVGEWLRHIGAVTEEQVTQILGLQWSIPVFPLDKSRRFLECAQLVPFRLLELTEMIPVAPVPASQQLFVAFVDRINYSALYAVEKMLACHTEPCLAMQSQIMKALNELRSRPRPLEILGGYQSDPLEMARIIASHFDRTNALDVRLSGFRSFIWVRMVAPAGYTDILFQSRRNKDENLLARFTAKDIETAFFSP
jgi:hypothetical protein